MWHDPHENWKNKHSLKYYSLKYYSLKYYSLKYYSLNITPLNINPLNITRLKISHLNITPLNITPLNISHRYNIKPEHHCLKTLLIFPESTIMKQAGSIGSLLFYSAIHHAHEQTS